MKAVLKNPRTGELKEVKVGFSFVLFFFSALFGLPLFLRGLYRLGAFMAIWRVFVIVMSVLPGEETRAALASLFLMLDTGLIVWLGLKGNEYTAKNLLEKGWVFAKPDSLEAQFAMSRWKIEPVAAAALPGNGGTAPEARGIASRPWARCVERP
ncbi:hypothetical protein V5F59_08545 [Xanthobacter autotrophicus DSM 431]|uniref:hypothetical protein n=1 Tax=Xanthobacter nonsaccharivorans TaxID=3119912 RepID=UPI003728CE3E